LNNLLALLGPIVLIYIGLALFFYWKQESFLFHPRTTHADFQYDFFYPHNELWFDTPNDGRIHGLEFKAENSKGVVFYLHGNAGSLRDWGWVYKDFVPRGYDLVLIDYRTYGKSKGRLSEFNLIQDALFVYDAISESYPVEKRIIYGRSLGTGIAIQLAAKREAKALVLETPYYSIKDLIGRLATFFPLELMLRYPLKSYQYLHSIRYSKYIIHGENDQVVPYQSGLKLFQSNHLGQIEFVSVPKGQHSDLSNFNEYKDLLNRVLV